MTDTKELIERLRRAEGNALLPKVLLDWQRADEVCLAAADAIEALQKENAELVDALEAFETSLQIAAEQAEDEELWFVPVTITEDYLQRALRRLTAAVMSKSPTECTVEAMEKESPDGEV